MCQRAEANAESLSRVQTEISRYEGMMGRGIDLLDLESDHLSALYRDRDALTGQKVRPVWANGVIVEQHAYSR